ncbi:MAG TPA: sigma-70 family RNA polymerase sigma factor [Blastocatellia bacterium]|nr:sigma-70 family RNA polymerase sigma factor [Blastocatellia bacterium]
MPTDFAETLLMTECTGLAKDETRAGCAPGSRLVDRAKAGDPAAFDQLMEMYQRRVISIAWRILGNKDDAQDAAQDTFLRAFKYIGRFRSGEDFSGWLYRIAINACRDLARKRVRDHNSVSLDATLEAREAAALQSSDDVEHSALRSEQLAVVEQALAQLTPREREALVLRDLEGMATEEVARILGSTPATVRSQISSARCKIKTFHDRMIHRQSRTRR